MNGKDTEKLTARVAVIVPCYNHGLYLGECLSSVIAQTFTDWVCVVVNDGSKDNTDDIARRYCQVDPRIHYLKQRNMGLSAARNNGIRSSQSEYILPLDADDMIESTYLEKTFAIFANNPDTKLVYTDCHLFGLVDQKFDLPDYSFKLLLQRNLITATALYRRENFNKTSGYDENFKSGWEDWDLWLSILDQDSRVIKVNEVLFEYRQKENSMVRSLTSELMSMIRNIVYYKHLAKYKQFSKDPEILAYRIKILEKEVRGFRKKDIFGRTKRKISKLLREIRFENLFGRN